ncbi:MAG: cytochrome P460 family protein [Deltaproteobacteria bacterium]|nr:cytochrome P460 family protein [Deltaproteobacteria bacterium]
MRWFSLALVFVMPAIAVSVFAASGDQLPPPEGKALWQYISQVDPYKDWSRLPGYDSMVRASSPHSRHIELFINDIGLEAYKADKPLPNGTIIVKVNYGTDKETIASITPMYKVEGYNPEAGDWFWGMYTPEGKVHREGKVFGCLNCHKKAKESNYVFTRQESD